jgi:hypothetical protein
MNEVCVLGIRAQAHALLAVAAATALSLPIEGNEPMVEAWEEAGAW